MLKTHSDLFAVAVAYDPEFLAALRSGAFPDYKLENHYGLLPEGEIPPRFAPTAYNVTDTNKMTFADQQDINYEFYDWFLLPKLLKKGMWSDPFNSYFNQTKILTYSVPMHYQGQFIGVIAVAFNMDQMLRAIHHAYHFNSYDDGVMLLADSGKILCHSGKYEMLFSSIYTLCASRQRFDLFETLDEVLSGKSGSVVVPHWNAIFSQSKTPGELCVVYTPVNSNGSLTIVSYFKRNDAMCSVYQNIAILWFAGVAAFLLLWLIVTLIVMRIYNPIIRMSELFEEVAQGKFDGKVPVHYLRRRSLIGRHAQAFDRMLGSLREQTQLVASEQAKNAVMQRDLDVARQIQETLLPSKEQFAHHTEFEIDAILLPARGVAGDFYDFWPLDDETVVFVAGDVSGKGTPAALVMVEVRTLLRQLTASGVFPEDTLFRANKAIQANNTNFMFTTMVFLFYNKKTGIIRYCNVGHTSPVIIRADGSIEWYEARRNPIFGVFANAQFFAETISLLSGDRILLYSDGVLDARSPDGVLYGEKNLGEAIGRLAQKPFAEFCPSLISELKQYDSGAQKDDITILLLKRK